MIKLSPTAWRMPCAVLAMGMALHMSAQCAAATPNKMDSLMLPVQTTAATTSAPIDALELVGVGVSVETWRNHPDYPQFNLWKAIQEGNGRYIISQDVQAYPQSFLDWKAISSKRNNDATEAAMREFMDRYALPIAVVGPSWGEPEQGGERTKSYASNANSFVRTKNSGHYTDRGEFTGLLTQSGQVMNAYLNDEPDLLWQTVFATFDQHADIPAMGVAVKDGAMHRALSFYTSDTPRYEKMAAEQAFRPKQPRILSESWTMLTLVQRDRVDHLRSYAPLVQDTMKVKNFGGDPARNWSEFAGWKSPPPQPFVPTPYLPQPWTPFQIDQFDHLENFGTLHRPQVVSYVDDAGKPVSPSQRQARFDLALRAALAPLGGKLPARIFYDAGNVADERGTASRLLPLTSSLRAPDLAFDLLDTRHGYDLSRILGDTGAGSPFVGVAVATMAGKQSGGASLVVNLRRDDGATILLVTPPGAEQVAKDASVKRPYWPRKEKPANAFKALFQRSGDGK